MKNWFKLKNINLILIKKKKSVLESLEHDLQEVNSNKDALNKNYLELQELRHILTKATHFFEEVNYDLKYLTLNKFTIYNVGIIK